MRIAILSPYPTFLHHAELGCPRSSGDNNATWTIALVQQLGRMPDTEVHVVTESDEIATSKIIRASPQLFVHFLKAPRAFKTLTLWQFDRRRLHRALAEIQPDIVHGQGIETQYGYATAAARYPRLITIHGITALSNVERAAPLFSRERLVEFFTRYCFRRTRNLVVVSPFIANHYRLTAPQHRVFQIPNAVNELFFAPATAPREPGLLVAVGYVDRLKAHDVLLRAMALLQQRGVAARAIICGPMHDPVHLATLRQLIDQHKLAVEFTGFQTPDQVATLLRRSVVLVHPSRLETFGMAIAEALATGTPVVATRVGGIPAVVQDGTTGLLFERDNAGELADKLQQLLENEPRRRQLGEAGRAWARDHYHPAPVAELTRRAYAEVLQAEPG